MDEASLRTAAAPAVRIGFIGAGHMGGAMLRGLAASSPRPALQVFDAAPGRAEALAAEIALARWISIQRRSGEETNVEFVNEGEMGKASFKDALKKLKGGK